MSINKYISRFNYKKLKIFSILLIFIFISFSGCINTEIIKKNEIIFGITSDISGFYPVMNRDLQTVSINENLFNSLVELDKYYKLCPGLAYNWFNPDNITWRFLLRNDIKFHDGNNFSVEDVNFTINLLKDLNFYSGLLDSIIKINIIDNKTIDLITDKPHPLLLYDLLLVKIISRDYFKKLENINESWPIGTGPYKLISYESGEEINLQRFEKYWGKKPEIKNIKIKILKDNEKKINALLDGEIDIASIQYEDISKLMNSNDLSLTSTQTLSVFYLSFDFREYDSYSYYGIKNPVSDVKVRNAIYHAINIENLIEKENNLSSAIPVSQFVTSEIFGYNPNIKRLEYDIKKAKSLMDDAGYNKGFNITLDCPDTTGFKSLCNKIADQLSFINITVELNSLPVNEYLDKLYQKNTSFYFTGINPLNAESTINLLLHSSNIQEDRGIWNYGNYSNKDIDKISEEITYEMNPEKRKEMIQEIYSIAINDIVWVPLYSTIAYYGINNSIIWTPRSSLYILFEDISIK